MMLVGQAALAPGRGTSHRALFRTRRASSPTRRGCAPPAARPRSPRGRPALRIVTTALISGNFAMNALATVPAGLERLEGMPRACRRTPAPRRRAAPGGPARCSATAAAEACASACRFPVHRPGPPSGLRLLAGRCGAAPSSNSDLTRARERPSAADDEIDRLPADAVSTWSASFDERLVHLFGSLEAIIWFLADEPVRHPRMSLRELSVPRASPRTPAPSARSLSVLASKGGRPARVSGATPSE